MIIIELGAQLLPAACTPNTSAYCCGYGILGLQFAGISSTSPNGSEGYQDRSCGNTAQVQEGGSYPWSVTTADATPHDTRIWIDMDNDGSFAANELIATALDQSSPSGSATIPAGIVYGTPVRLRVQSDVIGQSNGPCDAPLYGQVEDFSAVISQNTNPPTAAFTISPAVTCDGVVQFFDTSAPLPTNWAWDFGDGGTSNEQDPVHSYDSPGTYTVSLTAGNAFGSDQSILAGAVVYVPGWQCDTLGLDAADDFSSNECLGVLSDDGGPGGNYTAGTSGAFTIAPAGADHVTLNFSAFAWGMNPNRWLAIYDGPDVFSPLIDNYTGNGLGQLPNGGIITSSGPSITLRQEQGGGGMQPPNSFGFLLTWNCSLTGIAELGDPLGTIRPQPADEEFYVDLPASTDPHRTLILRDALGRLIEQRVLGMAANSVRFDVSDIPSGAYVLQLIASNASAARPIIIR
ncbi:MAG: PKD domain-containing protein [Flavobacteriales bacterium]|nr:PKD domain-containing protein [Flavobacteriales bacterium]